MRVILIVESPLSARDAQRFGLDIMTASGLIPEVWEIGPIYLPRAELQWRVEPDGYSIHRYESITELKAATARCTANDVIITLVGSERGQLLRYRELLRAISLTPAKLCAISATPNVQVTSDHAAVSFSARTRSLWSGSLRRPGIARRATQAFVRRRYGIRPLEILWVATTSRLVEPLLIDAKTRIFHIHSLDYDLVLRHRNLKKGGDGSILLLDTMGPDHPDHKTHGDSPWLISSDAYFTMLRGLLDQIEGVSGVTIEVAAHPRAQPGSLDAHYGCRAVHYGKTAEAISECRMVLLTNASTAVGLAVVMDKPIMMIRESRLPASELSRSDRLVSQLELAEWTPKSTSKPWAWPTPNSTRYMAYRREFVKLPGTPEQPFWEIVVAYLAKHKAHSQAR